MFTFNGSHKVSILPRSHLKLLCIFCLCFRKQYKCKSPLPVNPRVHYISLRVYLSTIDNVMTMGIKTAHSRNPSLLLDVGPDLMGRGQGARAPGLLQTEGLQPNHFFIFGMHNA